MPYRTISDLPTAQVDQYSHHQKEAFLAAFNNALKEYDGDESRASRPPTRRRSGRRRRPDA